MLGDLSLADLMAQAVAICRAAAAEGDVMIGALAIAGLVGGVTHCAGMCGPFVLAQVAAGRTESGSAGEMRRLRGGALAPYHAGRMTTYVALGAAAGALSGVVADGIWFRWLAAVLLTLAAALFLVQALGLRRGSSGGPLFRTFERLVVPPAARLSAGGDGGLRRYGLGVLLGFLPCGLLYAALAAAAATGNAMQAALAMAAFTLGTVPGLVGVGVAGQFFARRWGAGLRPFAATLLAVNAVILIAFAWSTVA